MPIESSEGSAAKEKKILEDLKTLLSNTNDKTEQEKIKTKVRGVVFGSEKRPRLTVFRSGKHIYAQIINDENSTTLVSCSTLDCEIQTNYNNQKTCYVSYLLGNQSANLSLKKNIKKIVFDRGRYIYHGRIQAVADGARAGGLDF